MPWLNIRKNTKQAGMEMRLFRIERKNMYRLWAWTVIFAALVFLVLMVLEFTLRVRTGLGTTDLQHFSTAAQYRAALAFWGRPDFALRAGFSLGLDYLFIPLYAVAMFCSGLVVQDYFAPRAPHILRRGMAVATLVPPFGALLDAIENGLQLYLLNMARADDMLADIAFRLSSAKLVCFYVGIALLLAALFSLRMRKAEKKLESL